MLGKQRQYVLVAAIAVVGLVGTVISAPILAIAQPAFNEQPPEFFSDQWIEQNQPKRLSATELATAKKIALAHSKVQEIIGEKAHKYISVNYVAFNANTTETPLKWLVDIHYNIEDKQQIGILIDMSNKTVVKTELHEVDAIKDVNNDPVYDQQLATQGKDPNGYAIARLSGTSQTPNRISALMLAPTFTNQISQTVGNVLLVNAQRQGATSGNACDPAHASDRYWAQVGLYWKTSGKINYDDTTTGCSPVFPSGISYQVGYNYDFRIYGRTTGWQIAMLGPGATVVNYFGPAINTEKMQTSDSRTSVFFENKLASGNNWAPQFSSNPTAHHAYWAQDHVTVQTWSSDVRYDQNCSGGQFAYPYDSTKQVISQSLTGAQTGAFSVSRMQANYPKC